MRVLFIIMSKVTKKTRKPVESEESEESGNDMQEQLLVGNSDVLGGYDDSQFEEANAEQKKKRKSNMIHLHFQQRTTRKCNTLVQGMPEDLDLKKIIRAFKKAWCCNGTTHEHEEWGTIIQLQGDKRRNILRFLIEEGIAAKEEIKIHGY